MAILTILLLGGGVAGALARPGNAPAWLVPLVAVVVALAAGAITPVQALHSLRPLAGALGFLLAAVPLAVLLDGLGFFESLSRLLARGRSTVGGLWILAALVTTALNLDASVVLLTPLYVRLARRLHLSPLDLAFQPVLLALLASSALPVSNLTNLIAVGYTHVGPAAFLAHLGPPSLAATAVGYWRYRRAVAPGSPGRSDCPQVELRPLVLGGGVMVVVLAGFVAGPYLGVAAWEVAVGADLALVVICRQLPWRALPWGTALVAAALAVLAVGVTSHLPVGRLVAGSGVLALARTTGLAALAANLVNNLPALLVAAPALPAHASCQLWSVLVGVNMGPVVLATGALASLLWMDALGRLDVEVGAADFARVGAKVGLPALLAATVVLLGIGPLLGCG